MSIKPRPYQVEMINTVYKEWQENGIMRQLVSLPTGAGKTICFAMLAQKLNIPTLVLAHREELLTQAKAKIKMVDSSANVGILQASTLDGLYSNICVASVQTAIRPHRLDALKRRGFKLLIVDEAHHATETNTYGTIINSGGIGSINMAGVNTPVGDDGIEVVGANEGLIDNTNTGHILAADDGIVVGGTNSGTINNSATIGIEISGAITRVGGDGIDVGGELDISIHAPHTRSDKTTPR